jgi:hypothetical protein
MRRCVPDSGGVQATNGAQGGVAQAGVEGFRVRSPTAESPHGYPEVPGLGGAHHYAAVDGLGDGVGEPSVPGHDPAGGFAVLTAGLPTRASAPVKPFGEAGGEQACSFALDHGLQGGLGGRAIQHRELPHAAASSERQEIRGTDAWW